MIDRSPSKFSGYAFMAKRWGNSISTVEKNHHLSSKECYITNMKILQSLLTVLFFSTVLFLAGCGETNSSSDDSGSGKDIVEHSADHHENGSAHLEGDHEPGDHTVTPNDEAGDHYDEVPDHATDTEIVTIRAKFVEFELGDASHFIFEDETGKIWDFGGNDNTEYQFAQEVPEEEADESNQGWGSDPKLQEKWFDIGYYETEREQYIDGPIGTVFIISEVKPVD